MSAIAVKSAVGESVKKFFVPSSTALTILNAVADNA